MVKFAAHFAYFPFVSLHVAFLFFHVLSFSFMFFHGFTLFHFVSILLISFHYPSISLSYFQVPIIFVDCCFLFRFASISIGFFFTSHLFLFNILSSCFYFLFLVNQKLEIITQTSPLPVDFSCLFQRPEEKAINPRPKHFATNGSARAKEIQKAEFGVLRRIVAYSVLHRLLVACCSLSAEAYFVLFVSLFHF